MAVFKTIGRAVTNGTACMVMNMNVIFGHERAAYFQSACSVNRCISLIHNV